MRSQPGETPGWKRTEGLLVVLGWLEAWAALLGDAEGSSTISSVLRREVGTPGWPVVLICLGALALLLSAAGEVRRLGVQPAAWGAARIRGCLALGSVACRMGEKERKRGAVSCQPNFWGREGHCPAPLGCGGLRGGFCKGSVSLCELLVQNLLLTETFCKARPC